MEKHAEEAIRLKLSSDTACYGHCSGPARHYFLRRPDIACFACGGGYISRIVMYGMGADAAALRQFIESISGGAIDVRDEDIRIATRHPWEMGLEGRSTGEKVMTEAYWNQNYRRGKSDDASRIALFRCTACGSPFTQRFDTASPRCGACTGAEGKASKVRRVHVVYANWCPHCVPTTVEPAREMASELGAELVLLDIDSREQEADRIVMEHGDWCADYIIPQLFFEMEDGSVRHVLTGFSEGVEFTRKAVEELRKSDFYRHLVGVSPS